MIVRAECCGAARDVPLNGCPGETEAPLDCGDCAPVRPCPGFPEATKVRGRVTCRQGPFGDASGLAGCRVEIVGLSGNTPVTGPVYAETDADGLYDACLDCGDFVPMEEVEARALCCGRSSRTPALGCLPETDLNDIECDNCSPCPTGFTRLQGRVHCRASGPAAGCRVRVQVETCDGLRTYFVETDREGRYRLCIPCPCRGPDPVVRVTAECCGQSQTIPVPSCGPITPARTMFCARCP